MNSRASGLLGILNKAGLLALGPAVLPSLRKASLLLLAEDASLSSVKKLVSQARELNIPILYIPSKQELGAPLGYEELSALAILSKKGAKAFLEKHEKGDPK